MSPRPSENTGFPLETLYGAALWDSGLSGRFREPGQTDFRQTEESSDRTCLESINARRGLGRSSERLSGASSFSSGSSRAGGNGRLNENEER